MCVYQIYGKIPGARQVSGRALQGLKEPGDRAAESHFSCGYATTASTVRAAAASVRAELPLVDTALGKSRGRTRSGCECRFNGVLATHPCPAQRKAAGCVQEFGEQVFVRAVVSVCQSAHPVA